MGSTSTQHPPVWYRVVVLAAIAATIVAAFLVGFSWPRPAPKCPTPPAPVATVSAAPTPSFTPVPPATPTEESPAATPTADTSSGEGTGKG